MHVENPVLPGFHPDPTVCRVGETFYLATSSFEYFPGISLYRSGNLVDWTPIGHALTSETQLDTRDARISGGIFAPTLRYHDGTFYLTTTNTSGGGHFVVSADDPAGVLSSEARQGSGELASPVVRANGVSAGSEDARGVSSGGWSDPLYVDTPGIDPDLFWTDDTCYFTYFTGDPDRGIEQATLDLDTGQLGEQRTVWTGYEDPHAEAPHIYERDGTYYLVVAEGGTHTGHMVVAARSDDPTGPFEPYPDNPVVSHRNDFYYDVRATGHADLVEDADGDWWLVCLGIRPHSGFPGWHHLGRETFLAPVSWADGWPVVDGGEIPTEFDADLPGTSSMDADPSAESAHPDRGRSQIRYTDTDFAEGRTSEWLWRRTPERDRYEFGDDGLVLRGGPETLDETGTTFLCRRQTDFDCRVRADLRFDPDPGDEAGLSLVMDEDHHYDVGVVGREAVVRLRIGDATDVVARRPVDERVTLGIDAATEKYEFVVDGETLADARTKYLATEVAGGFTGVVVGPYATGNGEEAGTDALVERFVYEPVDRDA